jgi:general secretion pathway protein G
MSPRGRAGFTLIEVMLVVAIIGILAALGFSKYLDFIERARAVKAVVDIKYLSDEIKGYRVAVGSFPASLADLQLDPLTDPWGGAYEYFPIPAGKAPKARKDRFLVPLNSRYDLYSKGKDGLSMPALNKAVSQDDVIRANDGAYIGLAKRY